LPNLLSANSLPNLSRSLRGGSGMWDDEMRELLIIAVLFGIGFALGYGVRDQSSRRRRHRHRYGDASPRPKPPQLKIELQAGADKSRHYAMDLDRLMIAANNGFADRRRPRGAQIARQKDPHDEFDVAVRDLLSELNQRSSASPVASRGIQG